MVDKIEHMKCDVCKKNITRLQRGDIIHNSHYDISRSIKTFDFDAMRGTFEEDISRRNIRFKRIFCSECFQKIVNESKTLGSVI